MKTWYKTGRDEKIEIPPPKPNEHIWVSVPELDGLRKAADPLLRFLNENYHPHVTVIVTPTSVELLERLLGIPEILDYAKD